MIPLEEQKSLLALNFQMMNGAPLNVRFLDEVEFILSNSSKWVSLIRTTRLLVQHTHGVSHSPASSETAGKGTAGTREASPSGSGEGRGAGGASPTPRRMLADSLVAFWARAGARHADDPRGPAPSSVAPRSPTSGPRDNRGSPHHPHQQRQAHPLPRLVVKDKQRWVGRVRHPAGVVRRLGGYLGP